MSTLSLVIMLLFVCMNDKTIVHRIEFNHRWYHPLINRTGKFNVVSPRVIKVIAFNL